MKAVATTNRLLSNRQGLTRRTMRRGLRKIADGIPSHRIVRAGAAFVIAFAIVVAGSAASGAGQPVSDATLPAHWVPFRPILAVVDLAGPRRDGSLTLALGGRLSLLSPGGSVPFARGKHGYTTSRGTEPYIALAPAGSGGVGGSTFPQGDIYALEPSHRPAVIRIVAQGHPSRFAGLPRGSFPNGIAVDTTGAFDHRLLVSVAQGKSTSILSVDSRGTVRTLTRRAPRVEGGMVVAPASFGAFAGDLIAPDELNGTVYAIDPHGVVRTVAVSGLPHGGDIGVESEGFVPAGFSPPSAAYLADRSVPGNAHPGTNSILRLAGSELARAGVLPGDLLVATEGGAETISVRCSQTCAVTHIGAGPAATHAEGHIAFAALG